MPKINSKKMRSALFYFNRTKNSTSRFCRVAHARNLALSAAIYTLVSAFLHKLKKKSIFVFIHLCCLQLDCPFPLFHSLRLSRFVFTQSVSICSRCIFVDALISVASVTSLLKFACHFH